ncbi:MAG: hypothetical protein KY460_15230, partial [Actinobacteria bacterium]|nr:hypothetical protein [Actinomycetota bacterium]
GPGVGAHERDRAGALQRHRHSFGGARERDRHLTWLTETSLTIPRAAGLWVIGAAVQQERYDASDVAGFDYRFTTPGIFAQGTLNLQRSLSLTASARVDLSQRPSIARFYLVVWGLFYAEYVMVPAAGLLA